MLEGLSELGTNPAAWIALATLVAMEVVLGIDNLIFISVLTNKLPDSQRVQARRIGIGLALGLRLVLLASIAWIVQLTTPILSLLGRALSWRDIILISGGLFLVWKATKEIHHNIDPTPNDDMFDAPVSIGFTAAISQIILLDLVFSLDSHCRGHCRHRHAGRGDAVGQLHRAQPDRRHAGACIPYADWHHADRRRVRRPCSQGIRLRRHGILGRSGGT